MSRKLLALGPRALLAVAAVATAVGSGFAGAAEAATRSEDSRATTWYVRASAPAGGDGSRRAPFDSLRRVERASGPGETIVVLPSPRSAAPLEGGSPSSRTSG